MLMKQARMEEGFAVPEMNPTHQPLSVVSPIKEKKEVIPPLFDLIEEQDYYLVSVDLPGLPDLGSEIEIRKGEIQVTHEKPDDSLMTNILFRARTMGNRVRAIYYEGALWLVLPKNGRSVRLQGVTDLLASPLAEQGLAAV